MVSMNTQSHMMSTKQIPNQNSHPSETVCFMGCIGAQFQQGGKRPSDGRLLETLARGMLCEGTRSFPKNSQTFAKPCDICEAVWPSNSKKGPFFPIGRGSGKAVPTRLGVRACRGGQIQGRVRAGSMGSGPRGVRCRAPYMTLGRFFFGNETRAKAGMGSQSCSPSQNAKELSCANLSLRSCPFLRTSFLLHARSQPWRSKERWLTLLL